VTTPRSVTEQPRSHRQLSLYLLINDVRVSQIQQHGAASEGAWTSKDGRCLRPLARPSPPQVIIL
jgi:hypothetical protein